MLKHRTGLALTAVGLALGALAGCIVTNQNHCALNQGICGEAMACSMCAIENNGCVTPGTVDASCAFVSATSDPDTTSVPPTTTTEQPTTIGTTETSDTTETTTSDPTTSLSTTMEGTVTTTTTGDTTDENTVTTEPTMCMGDVVNNPSCGGLAPYCVDGNCVGCEDLDCSEVEPLKPACAGDLGLCVECQVHADCVTVEKPACDPNTAICEACTQHDQCPATACNLQTGECFPEDNVFYVDFTKDDDITCSDDKPAPWGHMPSEPLCTLQNALTRLVEGEPATIKVKAGATKAQNLPSEMPEGNFVVAIGYYGNTVPSLVVTGADPALSVSEGNTVFMHRIGVYNSLPVSDPLIACTGGVTGAKLWLDRQRIFSGRTGIRAFNCQVHVRRSSVTGHAIGGIDIDGNNAEIAKLFVVNSYLTENNGTKFGAIRVGGVVDVDILYSTIALNKSQVNLAPIECVNNWDADLTIRNSVLINPVINLGGACMNPPLVNTWASFAATKAELSPFFSGFTDGVFQAKIGGKLDGVAMWETGDPRIDYDETLRPTAPGPDYAGADRPVP